jgi:hypothetical protein
VKKLLSTFYLLLFALLLSACDYGTLDDFLSRNNDVTARSGSLVEVSPPAVSAGGFRVLVLTDTHFLTRPSQGGHTKAQPINEFFTWLARQKTATRNGDGLPIAFCLHLGDCAETGSEWEYRQFAAFAYAGGDGSHPADTGTVFVEPGGPWPTLPDGLGIEGYGVPVYCVVGNHDLYNDGWNNYVKYCKPYSSFWRFEAGGYAWYGLDTGSGAVGEPQMNALESRMESDPFPKIVCTHYPLYAGPVYFSLSDVYERAELLSTYADSNVKVLLDGHYHPGGEHNYGLFPEHCLKSFRDGRAWYTLTLAGGSITLQTMTG